MANNSLRLVETDRFKEEAKQFFDAGVGSPIEALVWALKRNPYYGQQVRGSDRRVSVFYRDGFAYLVYYMVSNETIILESILKRKTPIAPGPLGLET